MRSLDPFAESDDIRTACIHPWFTGITTKPCPAQPHLSIIIQLICRLHIGRHQYHRLEIQGSLCRDAYDTRRTRRGCHLPRRDGSRSSHERMSMDAPGRRTRPPPQEGNLARGCVRYTEQARQPHRKVQYMRFSTRPTIHTLAGGPSFLLFTTCLHHD